MVWTAPLAILAAVALLVLAILAVRGLFILRARQELIAAFKNRLSLKAILALTREPVPPNQKGEARPVTSLSCAIQDYANLCARFAGDPAALTTLVRTVMAPLAELARNGGGLVSAFDGESFDAVWNAPLSDAEYTLHACETANSLVASLAAANARLRIMQYPDGAPLDAISVEIGIATGEAVAGAFDEAHYGVTGEPIVLARYVRALSAQYGFATVTSEEVKKAADQNLAFLELDSVVGAKNEPIRLYAMFGSPMMRSSPKFRALSTFHDHIFQAIRAQQWKRARLLIEQCRKLSGVSQKLYDLHVARIDWYEKNPPPADWDGAFRPVLK